VVSSQSWNVTKAWRVFVPTYANQLVMRFKTHVSFAPGTISGGEVAGAVSVNQIDDTGFSRGRSGPLDANKLVILSGSDWVLDDPIIRFTSATARDYIFDVREVAGKLAYVSLVCKMRISSGKEGLTMTADGTGMSNTRFIYQEGFHDNDTQFLGVATLGASPTHIPA